MPLTDTAIRQAKPKEKDYKLSDGGGLFLLVRSKGGKYWRQKYRFLGKEKLLSHGTYPDLTLAQARHKRDEAKKLLANNIDPGADKKKGKRIAKLNHVNTFKALAVEWHGTQTTVWSSAHAERVLQSLELDIFPFIGDLPINEVSPMELLETIKRVESREALDLASRLLQRCQNVFRYAVQTGRAASNPAIELKGTLKTRKVQHRASLSREELPGFLRKLENYDGYLITIYALKFLVFTFVRPGELRGAKWDEFDLKRKERRIPGERMKMKTPHIVPLSKQALALLELIRPISGECDLLFPGERSRIKPISDNTMIYALYRMGYKSRATPHGFRAPLLLY